MDSAPLTSDLDDHVYFSKEASSGGPRLRRRRLRMQLIGFVHFLRHEERKDRFVAGRCDRRGAGEPGLARPSPPTLLNTDFKGSLYYYAEDDRVESIGALISADYIISESDLIRIKFGIDTLTGASASGAVASDFMQTFSTPSGLSTYGTPANATPPRPDLPRHPATRWRRTGSGAGTTTGSRRSAVGARSSTITSRSLARRSSTTTPTTTTRSSRPD